MTSAASRSDGRRRLPRVRESFDEVTDSLVIDMTALGSHEGQLLCFPVPVPDADPSAVKPRLRTALRRDRTRHVPDCFMIVEAATSRGALPNPGPFLAIAPASGSS